MPHELFDFIANRMRMSHIYQPVMLKTLLANGGQATVRDIAHAILTRDESQLEYYENITRQMVGRVLQGHRLVRRASKAYRLQPAPLESQRPLRRLILRFA